ncbi:MotA/TolQ/ExbB proton channel family protein [Alteromonas sp. C1M14]|uniref:MotA/TolQ/ExbB proton channel family protein n=1 Tax=Alteromonas sp. C1M14 TaxID=2841567 RepID=UPI001C086AB4|nr:MotA/TolQ/ExbB proton channel family protein [Alteromonas sp. C1M14]MBU2978294.1 MotA/TolQ/ExbB proton channel family protein [Alteromonas sp. C1M14]
MKLFSVLLCVVGVMLSPTSWAQQQAMVSKIETAKQQLNSSESRIVKARMALSSTLRQLESEVIALREKTAVARRLADEKTLSLSKLEARLSEWKEQQTYQQNLLNRFLQQQGTSFTDVNEMATVDKMAAIMDAAQRTSALPDWKVSTLVLNNGELADAQALTIGPVTWFKHQDEVGIAEQISGRLQASGMLPGGYATTMLDNQNRLVLDPTLGRALTRETAKEGVIEHVVKGGIWVVPILLFAFIATVIGVVKIVQLLRLPKVVPVRSKAMLAKLLQAGSAAREQFSGMQATLLTITEQANSTRERDDQLFVQLQQDRQKLDKWINAVAVTAAVAPLLGLLGTVSGMIETFRMMTSFGSSDPEVISGGIAKALVTTELGLIVAIPALILNALLSRKARQYYTELENFALVLSGDDDDTANHGAEERKDKNNEEGLMSSGHPAGAG